MTSDQEANTPEGNTLAPGVEAPNDREMRRDSMFYQDTVIFQVEDTLFKVPRRGFESGSGVFATMFALPSAQREQEGLSDETPIILGGIKEDNFRSLLRLMYPLGPGDPAVSQQELSAALHLATMWDLKDIRRYAIARLDGIQMNSVDRIILAKQERVPSWLLSGYEELVGVQKLTLQKIDMLDWETIARLLYVQNQLPGNPVQCNGNHYAYCSYCGDNVGTTCCTATVQKEVHLNARALIQEVFEGELKGMQEADSMT